MTDQRRLRRAVASLAAALLACLVTATAALGHEVDRDVRYVVESVEPALDGVTLVVVRGLAPQVVVENRTDRTLEVLDATGRPFLRIGPDGVEADQAAHAWIDTADPGGIPPGVDVPRDLPAAWTTVREEPSWGWFDHRLHEQALTFDRGADRAEVLDRWQLDLRYGGEPVTVTGRTERRPVTGATVAAITGGNQPLPGVVAQVLPGEVPGLSLTASVPLTVLGEDGEPFLRFGADGVEANQRSPTWLRSGRAVDEGAHPADLDVDPAAEPRWSHVSDGDSYGWLDPRLAPPDELPAGTEVGAAGFATLGSWAVPLRAEDGTASAVAGEVRYVPLPSVGDQGRAWPVPLLAAGAGVVLLTVAAVRRRCRAPVAAGAAR